MRARSRTHVGMALVFAWVLAGFVPAAAQTSTSLIESGNPADVTLLYTGDVIGYLDPCG